MKKFVGQKLKIGIMKGGQLGRMLIQEMLNFNLESFILDNDVSAPAQECCTQFFAGNCEDFETVYEFGKKVDVLTVEFEHVNIDALLKLEKEGLPIFPSPKILKIIQDKGLQKNFYKENNIPTADFIFVENRKAIEDHLLFLPAVQKTRRAGYDGKGVYKIETPDHIFNAFDEPSILEKKIPFQREISVIVSRNQKGEIAVFPLVELEFHPQKNLVEFLFSPARIRDDSANKAKEIAQKIAETLEMIGVLAVEMFLLEDGQVLVNEMAPRVHNSGHHTIEACLTSQYEQHLRAILNLPLGSTRQIMPAVMVNLLGEPGYEGEAKYEGLEEVMALPGVFVHLYGKRITKPFRKMGHVTVLDDTLEKAKEKAAFIKKTLKVIAQ